MTAVFCKTYSQLISLSSDKPADSFYSTENYNQLGSLGPSLPKLEYGFPKSKDSAGQSRSINIQLKSIRPPYKFSTKLESVSCSQSIYKVKELLISTVDALQQAHVTPSNLKFMIRSKVLTDTTSIVSLAQDETDVSITVMVSAPSQPTAPGASKSPADITENSENDPADSVPLVLSPEAWSKIQAVLVAEVGSENGQIFLEKFKAVV